MTPTIEFTPRAYAFEIPHPVDETVVRDIKQWLADRGLPIGKNGYGTIETTAGRHHIRTTNGMVEIGAGSWLVLHCGLLHSVSPRVYGLWQNGFAR